MKFFELAKCLEPAAPGGLSRGPYMREVISMFATVTEDGLGSNRDSSTLPSDSMFESIASRDSGFTKKRANALSPRLNIDVFVERFYGSDLTTQELIAHDAHIDLENCEHKGDTGSGAKFNHLVALDIAVLRSTPLPFLIHASAIIKLIAFAPVAELLAVYINTANLTGRAGEPKQVFFSFDATKADGTKVLYGFTWNTETTDHHDPQPSEGDQR